jgi:hypothetical protein
MLNASLSLCQVNKLIVPFSSSEPAKQEVVQLVQLHEEDDSRYVRGAEGGAAACSQTGMSNPSYGQAIAV